MFNRRSFPYWAIAALCLVSIIGDASAPAQQTPTEQEKTIAIDSVSGEAEIALANHLKQTKVKLYGAYWCIHCYRQLYPFGQEALKLIHRIECASDGKNAQPDLCKAAKVQGFPTWDIEGKLYSGERSLKELADLSGYRGSRNFTNLKPGKIPNGLRESNLNLLNPQVDLLKSQSDQQELLPLLNSVSRDGTKPHPENQD